MGPVLVVYKTETGFTKKYVDNHLINNSESKSPLAHRRIETSPGRCGIHRVSHLSVSANTCQDVLQRTQQPW
jgi:hypothetical protein